MPTRSRATKRRNRIESPSCSHPIAARQVSPNDSVYSVEQSKKIKPTIQTATSKSDNATVRLIARVQVYNGETKRWGDKQVHFWPSEGRTNEYLEFKLSRGGTVRIFPNRISKHRAEAIREELLKSGLFRQYSIQCHDEPRAHFLLHDEASENFEEPQPGYRYGALTMKARPLYLLPGLEELADELAEVSGVSSWNIGINPVCFRGGQDKIGKHADDAQGETKIVSLLVDSPPKTRKVVISVNRQRKKGRNLEDFRDGDEIIELFMKKTDAYEMDGMMQESYVHEVPEDKTQIDHKTKRIAIIFRSGRQEIFEKDSGEQCRDLSPRDVSVSYTFGEMGLKVGKLYSRLQLMALKAHSSMQRGISGNKATGCDAIVVSGARNDHHEHDTLETLSYAAEMKVGAGAMITSKDLGLPIRVFRSSNYDSPHAPPKRKRGVVYRYDGLYKVIDYESPKSKTEPYILHLKHTSTTASREQCDDKTTKCDWDDVRMQSGEQSDERECNGEETSDGGWDDQTSDGDWDDGRVDREMRERNFHKDPDMRARMPLDSCVFGEISGLELGEVYSRSELKSMNAHKSPCRGISGDEDGCDAIVLSGSTEDYCQEDEFARFTYVVHTHDGARAMVKSKDSQIPIRVFRSSDYISGNGTTSGLTSTLFRYDGLYKVQDNWRSNSQTESYRFLLGLVHSPLK